MTVDPCDFVIFGGTGDLAVRKLLPALYLRDRDGQLTADTRIIAVARAGLDEPGYRDKIQAELGRFVAAELLDADTVDRFLARLRFVSIDLTEPCRLRGCHRRACRRRRSTSGCSTWPARPPCSGPSAMRLAGRAWSPSRRGWCSRSRSATTWPRRGRSTMPSARSSTSARSSASTTTSARRACRTCSSPGSPTRCSSRCGTPAGSTTSRSPPPNRSASAPAATTTTSPARCATCCRTTCCRCCAWSRWSRRPTSTARPSATRSSRCCRL